MRRLVLLSLVLGLAATSVADPIEWPLAGGGNGHYYAAVRFSGYFMTWEESRAEAASLTWNGYAGHLATITSPTEDAWLLEHVESALGCFLGGFQAPNSQEPSGGWQWVTGEEWAYSNWAPGEPNNSYSGPSGTEDCVGYGPMWNDIDLLNRPGIAGDSIP